MPRRTRKSSEHSSTPDMTPMIDVTFQLLIFFILCTRFAKNEENFQVELPKDESLSYRPSTPKEKLTIYCAWDDAQQGNSYVLAIEARGRMVVPGSFARLSDLVIYPSDSNLAIQQKQDRYREVFWNLAAAIEDYAEESGAQIEKFEISFAHDPVVGASSGTVPWMFVSTAMDATVQANATRVKAGKQPCPVTFKFADALGAYR